MAGSHWASQWFFRNLWRKSLQLCPCFVQSMGVTEVSGGPFAVCLLYPEIRFRILCQKSYIRWKPIKGEKRQKDVRYNTTVNPFPKHRWPSASISLLQIRRVQHLLHLLRLGCLCSVSQPRARHHLKVDSSSRWLASISTWTCPSEGEEVRTQNTLL